MGCSKDKKEPSFISAKCFRFPTCPGEMSLSGNGLYTCSVCGYALPHDQFLQTLKPNFEMIDDDYAGVPGYETVYDPDGYLIPCVNGCSTFMMKHEGRYVCPRCGVEESRDEFCNLIGADLDNPNY